MPISLAMVALGKDAVLSASAIQRDLETAWTDFPAVEDVEEVEGTISFRAGDAAVILGRMPAPIPWSDLEGPCATSWLWPEAAMQLRQHVEHIIVTVMYEAAAVPRTRLLTQVTAAVVATCQAAAGVYWGTAGLVVPPDLFRELAVKILPATPPVFLWVDYCVGRNAEGTSSGFTTGLAALDFMELETRNSPEPPGELRQRLIALSTYLIENGPVIRNGDTVGASDDERIRVLYAESSFGHPGRVMRLDYGQPPTSKPWWKIW